MRLHLGKWSSVICESVKIATMPVHNRINHTKGKAKRVLNHGRRQSDRGGRLEFAREPARVLDVRLSSVGSRAFRTKPLRWNQPGLPGVGVLNCD